MAVCAEGHTQEAKQRAGTVAKLHNPKAHSYSTNSLGISTLFCSQVIIVISMLCSSQLQFLVFLIKGSRLIWTCSELVYPDQAANTQTNALYLHLVMPWLPLVYVDLICSLILTSWQILLFSPNGPSTPLLLVVLFYSASVLGAPDLELQVLSYSFLSNQLADQNFIN